jgi:hypothetical protein
MPLFVALITAMIVGQKPPTTQKYGLSLILVGALIMIAGTVRPGAPLAPLVMRPS